MSDNLIHFKQVASFTFPEPATLTMNYKYRRAGLWPDAYSRIMLNTQNILYECFTKKTSFQCVQKDIKVSAGDSIFILIDDTTTGKTEITNIHITDYTPIVSEDDNGN